MFSFQLSLGLVQRYRKAKVRLSSFTLSPDSINNTQINAEFTETREKQRKTQHSTAPPLRSLRLCGEPRTDHAQHSKLPLLFLFFTLLLPSIAAQQSQTPPALEDLKRGEYQRATSALNQHLSQNPSDTDAQQALLCAYLETGRYKEAEDSANRFLEKQPGAGPVRLALGNVYAAIGRYAEAITEFERASRDSAKQSGSPFTRLESDLRRAEILKLTGQEDQARAIFQTFVSYYNAHNPQTAPELTFIARALVHLEKYKDANDLFLAATNADASYIEAHLGGGELFTEKYNYAEAAEFFRDALKINPNSAHAHLGIAANKRLEGGPEMVRAILRALEINPNFVEARALHATTLLEAERYEKAAEEIEVALKINPNSLEACSARVALLYLQDKDFETEAKQILAINPRYGKLYDTLAHFATMQRRYAQAATFARRAVELSPRLWRGHLSLGMALLRLGRMDEGRAAVEASFKGDPFNIWAKNTLDLLDAMRDYKETARGPFIVKAAAKENDALAPYVAELLEEATAKLTAKYRFTPKGPILIELFPNHEDFAVRALGLPGLGALGVCFGQVVALDSPSARPIGQFNWGSTLWHEYMHVITLQMTEHRIPRWFSEGLSVYEERRGRPGWGDDWNAMLLKALAAKQWFKISDLDAGFQRPTLPTDVPLAYFQASQICEFIVDRYGFDAILQMLARYRDKAKTPEVLQQVLKLSEDEFDRAFDEYIRQKAQPLIRALDSGAGVRGVDQLSKEAIAAMVQSRPDDFMLQMRAAAIYQRDGDTEKAIAHYKRAIELYPYHTDEENAYTQLAKLYEKQGNLPAAAETLEQLIKQDENNLEALKKVIQLRLAHGDKERALQAMQLAFFISPFDSSMHTQAGNLYLEKNNPAQAAREFQIALALEPPNIAEANYNLARALFAAGKNAEAKRAVLRSLEAAPSYEKAQELLLKISGQ